MTYWRKSLTQLMESNMERIKNILEAIRTWLDGIPSDKLLHGIAGAIITAAFALIKPFACFAFSIGIIAGILKEWYDGGHGGNQEFADFVATGIGAIVMQIVIWLMLICW